MLRRLVAITPITGAIIIPLLVPLAITRAGISTGVVLTLLLSSIWFIAMLKTSEMPH